MKQTLACLAALAIAAPALAQGGPLIGESATTHKLPNLTEARDCAAATGYWVSIRRVANKPSRIYESSLAAWSTYIQQQTREAPGKVEEDIMADVQRRARNRDSSWALKTLVACAAFERQPAPPPALADKAAP